MLTSTDVDVLVIEAGEFDNNEDFVTIPGLAGGAVGTKYDWNISYAAQEGLGGRVTPIPLGKIVGGSTKLNRMVFDRGSKSDYDGWEALGNKGWSFADLLPYLKKVCEPIHSLTPNSPSFVEREVHSCYCRNSSCVWYERQLAIPR